MTEPKNYYGENNIVCPHCGWVDHDSWDHAADSGKAECGNEDCGQTFHYDRCTDITYNTRPL